MTTPSAGVEIPVPEPELTPGDMLARARGLRELLRQEQPATEELLAGMYSGPMESIR